MNNINQVQQTSQQVTGQFELNGSLHQTPSETNSSTDTITRLQMCTLSSLQLQGQKASGEITFNSSYGDTCQFSEEDIKVRLMQSHDLSKNQLLTPPREIVRLQPSFFPRAERRLQELSSLDNGLPRLPRVIALGWSLASPPCNLMTSAKINSWIPLGRSAHLHPAVNLIVRYNQIQTLPSGIGNLSALEKLFLTSNKLETLPQEFGALKALNYLHIERNINLNELPKSLGQLPCLKSIVHDNPELTDIVKSIIDQCKTVRGE